MVPDAEPPPPAPAVPVAARGGRLLALDAARGVVILLMAVDHSSGEFNAGRLITDGVFLFKPGTPLPPAQFFTRWITHLCAPTFVFLAGVSLALSIARRRARGVSAWDIDRHLLARGLIIMAAEIVPSTFWMEPGHYLFQVLYAIGSSYLCMIALRRLPAPVLAALALAELVCGEAITHALGAGSPGTSLLAALLFTGGPRDHLIIAYPTLPWLAIMLFGYAWGERLRRETKAPALHPARLAGAGAALLALFVVLRGLNGYGNMGLPREGGSVVQWLHVSKYPPSITYVALELGIMALLIALLARAGERRPFSLASPLLVFGQTSMFFYLLHIPLLALLAHALGVYHALGIGAAFGFAAVAALVLFPLCRWYRTFKATHPASLARFF
ncbi:MAG TPA: heparan-alpha-glucosaminide N-acetyltransferase domain-containing protein [Polyangiaceae bacterium]|nr:heparan-alpha-glucosaminide N-acetyltransferase domain-containing protein [Polyangiaceae bacterium]